MSVETLHLTGRDSAGQVVDVDLTITRSNPTLFGSDAKVVDLKRLPGIRFTRRFSATAAMPSLADVPAGVMVCASAATLPDPKAQAAWFAAHVGQSGWITVKHEVNTGKKGTPAQFKSDLIALKGMRDAAGAAGKGWGICEIYALYPQLHGGLDWSAYTTGVADVIGWDCYLERTATGYPDPEAFFAPAVASAKAAGKPLMVPEFGCLLPMPFDPTGTGAALWLTACADYLRSIRVVACAEWDNPQGNPTTGPAQTYVLSGAPLNAWAKVLATA